jgi:hypothetical protein
MALNTSLQKWTSAATRIPQPANKPMGVARGIYPGRVVWMRDPNATDWEYTNPGQSEHWYQPQHTSQDVVNTMVSRAICSLAGQNTDAAAWDAIFKYYNQSHGKGDVGYTPGEKIAVKINFTLTYGADPCTMDKPSDPGWGDWYNWVDNSPQLSIALLRQLTDVVGVEPCNITIGDPGRIMPNYWYDMVEPNCPGVIYLARFGGKGRTQATWSDVEFYWSDPDPAHWEGVTQHDHIPVSFADADYLINFAILKSHSDAGVTLCGKNLYGALIRNPSAWEMPNAAQWYSMHWSRILPGESPGMGRYRAIVDLMSHPQLGGKTVLYLVDGLFAGEWWNGVPVKWNMMPFNGDWPSSIFVSQDAVAVDSVCFDFLLTEWPKDGDPNAAAGAGPNTSGADDYLHEAALANDPCSATAYDPDGDGNALTEELGVHEHWNNSASKQYSRNLGAGSGIELVALPLDPGQAYNPKPGPGAAKVNIQPALTWEPGKYVAYGGPPGSQTGNGHHVFFHTNFTWVNGAALSYPVGTAYGHLVGAQDVNNILPAAVLGRPLALGQTYYWRVIEVNNANPASPWKSEIWSFVTDRGVADNPQPPSGTTLLADAGVPLEIELSWLPGTRASDVNGHQVYFGTTYNDVNDANIYNGRGVYRGSITAPSYTPSDLRLGATYYWRIDEVNDPCLWKGDVWNFAIPIYRVVDDFEGDKNDDDLNARWQDGSGALYNGSRIFHAAGSSMMEYAYDNNGTGSGDDYYSEIVRDWPSDGINFTLGDDSQPVRALALSFKGSSRNSTDPTYDRMYVALEDSGGNLAMVLNIAPDAAANTTWTQWNIDLRDFADPCIVDLSHIKKMYVGFGVRGNPQGGTPGGEGTVFFDDFRLYIPRCVGLPGYRQQGDIAGGGNNIGDCIVNEEDLRVIAQDWLNTDFILPLFNPGDANLVANWNFDNQTYDNNDRTLAGNLADGTPHGNAGIVYDADLGSFVLHLPQTDSNDYVDCGGGDPETWGHLPHSFTLSAWVNQTEFKPWGCFVTKGEFAWKLQTLHASPVVHFATHQYGTISQTQLKNGQWYHVAAMYYADWDYVLIYIDGQINGGMAGWPEIYDDWDWANVFIGARHTPYYTPQIDHFFKGYLDDIRIYNRALYDQEVKFLATRGAQTWYYPLESPGNIYDGEPQGQKIVNFRDFALLANDWLEADLWPPGL